MAHTRDHIRNYFASPPWYQSAPSKAVARLPSPPPSSTGSVTATTIAESARATPPLPITDEPEDLQPPSSEDEKIGTFADSPDKVTEYRQDFPPLQSPTGSSQDKIGNMSPYKRRASGLDMDLMSVLPADDEEVEIKPSVWPVTLTHMMGCGELGIGNLIYLKLADYSGRYDL